MIPEKEIQFFNRYTKNSKFKSFDEFLDRGIVGYETTASNGYSGQRYLIDASPSSFSAECGPKSIADTLGEDVQVLITIRNPAERAFSDYIHHVVNWANCSSFSETLQENEEFMQECYYSDRLEQFMNIFPGRCHILLFENLTEQPNQVFASIFQLLDLAPFEMEPAVGKNTTAGEPVNFGTLDDLLDVETADMPDFINVQRSIFLHWRERNNITVNASDRALDYIAGLQQNFTKELSSEDKVIINRKHFEPDILELERLTGYDLSAWLGNS